MGELPSDDEMDYDFIVETVDTPLNHIVLPRVLPQKCSEDLNQIESEIIKDMVTIGEQWLPRQTQELLMTLRRHHNDCNANNIWRNINQLRPGNSFAMFVRAQSCAIMVHVPPNEELDNVQNVIVATFPGNLDVNEIYRHDSDIEFNYPERAIKVKFSEMLRSRVFANQLYVLNEGVSINAYKRLNCVSQWLLTLLMDENSVTATETEFPVITKKIRDEVLGNKDNFYRRSSFFMSIKAMLQHSLTLELGTGAAESMYKIFMLKFLIHVSTSYTECSGFNIDLISQTIAKIARRIEKLSKMMISDDMEIFYNVTIDAAKKTIKTIHEKIYSKPKDKSIIEKMHKKDEEDSKLPVLTESNLATDICQKYDKLQTYLNERNIEKNDHNIQKSENGFKPPACKSYKRFFKSGIPNVEKLNESKNKIELRIFWMDFERIVLYETNIQNHDWSATDLRSWSIAYAKFAENSYKENPLFISRMLLVRLKLIAMLDKRATKEHPLLLQHRSGVNANVINSLLLPQIIDMRIAFELETYFHNRDDNSYDPGLIEQKTFEEDSFSVKYAREDLHMNKIREEILAKDEANMEEKRKEFEKLRDKAEQLRNKAKTMQCDYDSKRQRDPIHSNNCKRHELVRKANNMTIKTYEQLLPKNETDQFVIVFELQIPQEIACLRDILYSFAEFCHGEPRTLKFKGNWVETLSQRMNLDYVNSSKSEYVSLGSTTKQSTTSLTLDSWRQIIVPNSFNCILLFDKSKAMPAFTTIHHVKKDCTFTTKDEYESLQRMLHSTHHTENEVLSSQSKCGTSMTLSEYKNFGSLRADGHRLQIRKLYAMIATEGLSFEKEAVLVLVMQTLWECEKIGEAGFVRESHIDFRNAQFCNALIKLLEKFVEQQKKNWMHPFKLLTLALIAVRAFEINETEVLAEKIAKLLVHIRGIALEWITDIQNALHNKNHDENTERNLRLKLIYVAILGGITYFIHPKHIHYQCIFPNSMENKIAVKSWLRFIITLKNNVHMYTNDEKQLPPNLRMFLHLIDSIGVSMESYLTEIIERDSDFVFDLIKQQWTHAEYAIFNNIYFDHEFPQILIAKATVESNDKTVTIDIITGSFLVDGLPLSRLPAYVMHSDTYRWFFEDVVFEVQPDAEHNFSTVHKYNECTYEFQMIKDSIIIIERKGNDYKKELINQKVFDEDFPYYLVKDYSHWWNEGENCIEFRKRTSGKKHFSKETTIDYRLDLNNHHLIHEQTQRPLLDIKSESYKKITDQLSRLEHRKYIHVLYFEEDETARARAKVEMLRMNLKFTVEIEKSRKHSFLISNEFNGMRVSRTQKIGTLCGLKHGLLLESNNDKKEVKDLKKMILLIPNGHIEMKNQGMFASVSIKIKKELRSPPFYQYQVDNFCCQLKSKNGSHASWFLLAYLHAITSHGQIEPFTGLSGTERAIQILQSAYAWSSSPYDSEALRILKDIASLTPLRELNDGIQSITWPKNIPQHSAQDCFAFIAIKLQQDSHRLRKPHSENSDKKVELKTNMKLNRRDHHRCQKLNPNLNISDTFIERKTLKTSPPFQDVASFSSNMRTICILHHMSQFHIPINLNLVEFLTGIPHKTLDGRKHSGRIKDILNHSVHEEFRDLWISLYDAAVSQNLTSQYFTMILSMFTYANKDIDIKPILALQAIASKPNSFRLVKPPENKSFQVSHGYKYKAADISKILKKFYKQPVEYDREWRGTREQRQHNLRLTAVLDDITATIKSNWPCNSIDFTTRWPSFPFIDYANANAAVNDRLKIWYANWELNNFIKKVEVQLHSLGGIGAINVPLCPAPSLVPKRWRQFSIDFEAKMYRNSTAMTDKIEQAKNIWQLNMNSTESKLTSKDWWRYYKIICNSNETSYLIEAGIFPRMVPSLLLPKILDRNFNQNLKCLIGAAAITITREQRDIRMKIYQHSQLNAAYNREIENEPFKNWSPIEYPEWLLFEIEQNLTIRRIQVEIAKRMMNPPEIATKHSVMQLNMGEGKTSVIVPILAAKLSDGNRACQIIVLKSLFATNLKSLRQYLGGLLNRRIYTFPCRRDMPIENHAHEILEIYEECKREKGVILTLPEYRLSFQLKIYESIGLQLNTNGIQNFTVAKNLLEILKWTNENVRSVLDESDAILHAKYQLVYTMGNQKQPDGDCQRWLVAQALLKRIPFHMKSLHDKYGKEKVEFGHNTDNFRTDIFTPFRILDDVVFEALKNALIDDFLNGRVDIGFPGIDDTKRPALRRLLSEKAIDKDSFRVIEHFSEEKQNIIYILSGLMRFEVLKLVLTKRWRVNYGVDVDGPRKMAIPFKAKDVAAELTEFGHPDVAVCFTQMSYYYSGLSDIQLCKVFNILENSPDAAKIYEKWINSIPIDDKRLDASIKSYSGINLDDPSQRNGQIFPLFRFNMRVIDFWLSNVVYPHELKIFEKKIMCTAWDLCSDNFEQVTGFSGTNDTKDILPLPIAQNDLPELETTNEEMREILLDPRNRVYTNPANMSGKQILEKLVEKDIPVLLDSGALMLELNNKEVAIEWLKLAKDCSAAVYFDEHDTLQTIDRHGVLVEYDYSVYREDLSSCVVYLDDVHTRGTDLKFPPDWAACVTLSGDITRDKVVQSCMRMRQLKTTQTLYFLASYEADIRVRQLSKLSPNDKVESKHVMEFIENNSRLFETANMPHWTAGALNYTKKLIAQKIYEEENDTSNIALEKLYNACVDNEFVKLKEMYGEKEEALLSRMAWNQLSKFGFDLSPDIRSFSDKMRNGVVDKLKKKAGGLKRFTHALDEEQEKELEQEIEEQTQKERPNAAKAATPNLDKRLRKLVLDGVIGSTFDELKADNVLMPIVASLSNTQIFEFCENNEDAWAQHLLVTKDFTTVIENQTQTCNDFLRPVSWVARIKNPNNCDILILLSSFECNHLIPAFRNSINATLFMYRARLSNLHSNLIREAELQLTGMATANFISVEDEIQIGVYAGLMYFGDVDEQRAYCSFLGIIPRPWTHDEIIAHEDGFIEENGYVPFRKRNYSEAVSQRIRQCKFKDNPINLVIKLIKAHHQMLPKDSHVASILNHGVKSFVEEEPMHIV